MVTSRRTFLGYAAAASAGVLAANGTPAFGWPQDGRIDRVGVGLFTIPTWLERGFDDTMRRLAAIGYREVETFGPYPFSAASARERWATVSQSLDFRGSGYFGLNAAAVRKALDAHGLTSPSMHTDLESLRSELGPMAEAAHTIGQRFVVLPSIPAAERQNLDGYRRMADVFNEIGRRASAFGLRFVYHNHGYGLAAVDGQIPFEVLVERTDPSLVFLQMDLYWVTAGGADPISYLKRYAGRYVSLHIKDMTRRVRFAGDGGDSGQWIALFPYIADAGRGVLDLPAILAEAHRSGVRHFFVERDQTPTPQETLEQSYRYLAGVRF